MLDYWVKIRKVIKIQIMKNSAFIQTPSTAY